MLLCHVSVCSDTDIDVAETSYSPRDVGAALPCSLSGSSSDAIKLIIKLGNI